MVLQNYINQLVTYLLDKLIGKYVENFTSHNVQTGLYQGDIKLVNLPLKSDVLEDITDWPIKVQKGVIGSVVLRIPYTKLRSQAWAIMLDEIYIVASLEPNRRFHSKEKLLEKEELFRKELLESLESKWWKKIKQQKEKLSESGESNNSWMSYVASLGYRILRNIQIEVRNVHIRFEDNYTMANSHYSIGFVINELAAKSADFDWESSKDPDVNSTIVKKLVNLKDIGVYLDPDSETITSQNNEDELRKINIKELLSAKLKQLPEWCFIIKPISINATSHRHTTALPLDNKQARIELTMEIDQLEVSLSQNQYRACVMLTNEIDRFDNQRQHIRNRPTVPIIGHPRDWWVYSIKENLTHQSSISEVMEKCKKLSKYVKFYEDYLLGTNKNEENRQFLIEYESELDLDLIVSLREFIMERAFRRKHEIKQLEPVESSIPESSSSWWSYIWRTRTTPNIPPVDKLAPLAELETSSETSKIIKEAWNGSNCDMKQVEDDFYKMLHEVDIDAVNFFTRDRVFLKSHLRLSSIKLRLLKSPQHTLLFTQASELFVQFETRPQIASWQLITRISNLVIHDEEQYQHHGIPIVAASSSSSSSNNQQNNKSIINKDIFYLAYEKNPLNVQENDVKHRLLIRSQPLKIVHSPLVLNNITEFFSSYRSSRNIRAAAKRHLLNAKTQTSKSLQEILEQTSDIERWEISLQISAPQILLPEKWTLDNNDDSSCLLVDLGQLRVSNCDDKLLEKFYLNNDGDGDNGDYNDDNNNDDDNDDDDDFFTPVSSPNKPNTSIKTLQSLKQAKKKLKQLNYQFEQYSVRLEQARILIGSFKQLQETSNQSRTGHNLSRTNKNRLIKNGEIGLVQPCNMKLEIKRLLKNDNEKQNYKVPPANIIVESKLPEILITISDDKLIKLRDCLKQFESTTNNTTFNINDDENRTSNSSRSSKQSSSSTMSHKRKSMSRKATLEITEEEVKRYEYKNQLKQLIGEFILNKFTIQMETNQQPLAELTLSEVQLNYVKYQDNYELEMCLFSLVLADIRTHLGDGLDFVVASHQDVSMSAHLIEKKTELNQDDEPLIKLRYRKNSLKHHLQVTFSDVSIIANQETLSELLALANCLNTQPINKKSTNHKQEPIKPSENLKNLNDIDNEVNNIEFELISTRLSILLVRISRNKLDESKSTYIETNTIKVALIVLSNMKLTLNSNGTNEELNSSLASITVHDLLNPIGPYNTIFSLANKSTNQEPVSIQIKKKTKDIDIIMLFPHCIYIHSPYFLHNFELCISDFRHYFSRIKSNIQSRASKEIATHNQFLSNITIDLSMSSPILILPKYQLSTEIFVIKLGDIQIKKLIDDINQLNMQFTDAHIISKLLKKQDIKPEEMLKSYNDDFPVINSMNFEWNLTKNENEIEVLLTIKPSLSISMNKQVYEQILQSSDNLVYDDDDEEDVDNGKENEFEKEEADIIQDEIDRDQFGSVETPPIIVRSDFRLIEVNLYADTDTTNDYEQTRDPVITAALRGLSLQFTRHNKYIKEYQLIITQLTVHQILDSTGHRIYKPLIYSCHTKSRKTSPTTTTNQNSRFRKSTNLIGSSSHKRRLSCPDIITTNTPKRHKTPSHSYTPTYINDNFDDLDDILNHSNELMHVNIKLIDKKIPNFQQLYQSYNRFVKMDFNVLQLSISLEIWVILLDFFGLGSRFYDPDDLLSITDVSKVHSNINRKYDGEIEEIINTYIDLKFKQICIILENQVKYYEGGNKTTNNNNNNWTNLMSLTCLEMILQSKVKDGNMELNGSVSNFHICDLSPTNLIYNYRIFPSEIKERIFEFKFFKFGLPDTQLLRKHDIELMIKISAPIVYIHTQRFLQEIVQFTQNFMQYQDRLREIRVTSAGRSVDKSAPRSSRILLDISCHAPLLVLPVSAFSDYLLIADLGHLTVSNSFHLNSDDVLLDTISLLLTDMDVYTAYRINPDMITDDCVQLPFLAYRTHLPKPFRHDKPTLLLNVIRNLDCNRTHCVPDWKISAEMTSIVAHLDLEQYQTIRGVLCYNLGENIDFLKSYQYQAFETDPKLIPTLTGESWISLLFEINLNDVQVHLQLEQLITLCKINFLHTHFLYCSYSDSNKVIELNCDHITLEDLRFCDFPANQRLNVFSTILTPDTVNHEKTSGQVHIRYETRRDKNLFDVKLNKMQVMLIFNWLKLTNDWIFAAPFELISLYITNYNSNQSTKQPIKKQQKIVQSEFEIRAKYYLISKSDMVLNDESSQASMSHKSTRRYRQITKELFRSTHVAIEALESQFRVLENSACHISPVLILTVAGALKYQTRDDQPPSFSLNISQLHLTSCCMPIDTSTTPLSIINPLEIDLSSADIPDESSQLILTSVAIQISSFKIRLSFHDMTLLASIFKSLIRQYSPPANVAHQSEDVRKKWGSNGTQNSLNDSMSKSSEIEKDGMIQMMGKSIREMTLKHCNMEQEFISICLIDDCIDADVPLFDLRITHCLSQLKLSTSPSDEPDWIVKLQGHLSLDHYSTNQFVWTPIIVQSWPFELSYSARRNENRKFIELHSTNQNKRLEFDISAHLIQIAQQTKQKWTQQLKQFYWINVPIHQNSIGSTLSPSISDTTRRWRPNMTYQLEEFAPFLVENHLGVTLLIRKLPLNCNPLITKSAEVTGALGAWQSVSSSSSASSNHVIPVCFESEMTARDKIRYNKYGLHCDYRHRIELKVEGWRKSYPVTVDKLGVFYRDLFRDNENSELNSNWTDDTIRVVIEIIRQGSVQNKIIIRSGLTISNTINVPLEIQLSPTNQSDSSTNQITMTLSPLSIQPIPINCVRRYSIRVRPTASNLLSSISVSPNSSMSSCTTPPHLIAKQCLYNEYVEFSDPVVSWTQVSSVAQRLDQQLTCPAPPYSINPDPVYLICTVEKLKFPSNQRNQLEMPGHNIIISAPFTIENLLPCDLKFLTRSEQQQQQTDSPNYSPTSLTPIHSHTTPSKSTRNKNNQSRINSPAHTSKNTRGSSGSVTSLIGSLSSSYVTVRASNKCAVLNCSSRFLIRLFVAMEMYPRCDALTIPGDSRFSHQVIVCVYDEVGRLLELQAKVDSRPTGPVTVKLFAPYWIINKTSLPLVFCQSTSDMGNHGSSNLVIDSNVNANTKSASGGNTNINLQVAAGYSDDYERARSPQPLLFSFTNRNEDLLLQMRLGKETPGVVEATSRVIPQWSQRISIDKAGTTTVQLRASIVSGTTNQNSKQHLRPPITFNIGLEVRPGRGRHSVTNMVVLTARYILDNRSSYPLHFAQNQCLSLASEEDSKPILALPNSVMTFHWPREDFVPLLSVQKLNETHEVITKWSGGFLIDKPNSFHIYLKGISGHESSQIRITVIHESAIFRVIFSDVAGLPSPYELVNTTGLQLFFYQDITDSAQIQHHLLPANTSLQYALDYPTEPAIIHLAIEGGTQSSFYLDDTRQSSHIQPSSLYYDNFLYLTVTSPHIYDPSCPPLVFDVPQNSRRIILRRKSPASRAQLWYYSHNNELFHEGSVAPHDPKQRLDRFDESHLLLDIAMLAPQPSVEKHRQQHFQLILAKPDSRRSKFQRWFFSEDGCLYNQLGIKCTIDRFDEGAVVTSGYEVNSNYFIYKEYLRPGSGIVDVTVLAEGPTRVVRIEDRDEAEAREKMKDDKKRFLNENQDNTVSNQSRLDVTIEIKGLGMFLIEDGPEELIYVCLEGVWLRCVRNLVNKTDQCQFNIQRIQVDNQLSGTMFPCVLFEQSWKQSQHPQGSISSETRDSSQINQNIGQSTSSPTLNTSPSSVARTSSRNTASSNTNASINVHSDKRAAFSLRFERQLGHQYDIHVFNYIKARLVAMTVLFEEKLILKILKMFHKESTSIFEVRMIEDDDDDEEEDELSTHSTNQHQVTSYDEGKKVYIGKLQLLTGTIKLSVITSESLSPDLKKMKKLIPSLMGFTNAQISIEPYDEEHVFNTSKLITESIIQHMRSQLRSQAIKIFGTVDFLGNPMGFISDISNAMRLFYAEKNVKSMVQHFAHGIGDSTAKICGSAGRLVSELAMDPVYAARRQELFEAARLSDSKSAQMMAGVRSFWHGLYGGIKSVPTQSWRGYQDEGASGFVLGTFKGVLGIFAKPVGGMLDLATGTATSFREMARSSRDDQPTRFHQPRSLTCNWKILPSNRNSTILIDSPDDLSQIGDIEIHLGSKERFQRAQKILSNASSNEPSIADKSLALLTAVNSPGSTNKSSMSSYSFGMSKSNQERILGFIPMQKTYQNTPTSNDLEILITNKSLFIVRSQTTRILKHFLFSNLSVPPIAIVRQDGSIYIRICHNQSSATSTTATKTNITTSSTHNFNLYQNNYFSPQPSSASSSSQSTLLPSSTSSSPSSYLDNMTGPLFKCDSDQIAYIIIDYVCEAFTEYLESILTVSQ